MQFLQALSNYPEEITEDNLDDVKKLHGVGDGAIKRVRYHAPRSRGAILLYNILLLYNVLLLYNTVPLAKVLGIGATVTYDDNT
jgi:hypothetical protein